MIVRTLDDYFLAIGYLAAFGAGAGGAMTLVVLIWRSTRTAGMRLSDLVRDEATGLMSHTKASAIAVNLAAIVLFMRICWNASPSDGVVTLFVAMLAIIGGSQVASKLLGSRFGGGNGTPPGTTTSIETSRVVRSEPTSTGTGTKSSEKGAA